MNGQINNQAYYFQLLLLSSPVLLGIVVALAKPLVFVNWTDRLGQWAINKRANYSGRKGYLSYFLRPFFGAYQRLINGPGVSRTSSQEPEFVWVRISILPEYLHIWLLL